VTVIQCQRNYRCWNDCDPRGCPGHTAALTYQSVSEAFRFDDGKGRTLEGQTPEFACLVSMLREMRPAEIVIDAMFEGDKP
jgi:hypothetical protein